MMSFGYEIIVQPALYLAAFIAVLVVLLRGSTRSFTEVEGIRVKGRRQLAAGAKRRALLTAAGAVLLLPALVITPPGHRGVIYNLSGGVSPVERPEGLSLVIPWYQTARMVNVRTQVYVYEAYTQTCADELEEPDEPVARDSCDLQEITLPIAINYRVDPMMAAEIYQETGLNYVAILIDPIAFQATTQATGELTASEIVSRRGEFALRITSILSEHLTPTGLVVERVSVKDAIFDPDFISAVKQKIIADQKAAEAERLIDVATAQAEMVRREASGAKDANILRSEGEEEAIGNVASALGFTAEQYLDWIWRSRWDGQLPKTVVGQDASLIFDVGQQPE